jgi:hypothetical protein
MRWGWSFVLLCALFAPSLDACAAEDRFPASAGSVLSRWERASAGLLGVGPMEHRRLFYLHQEARSAHEIALLNEFRGPVSAADLARRFDWSLQENAGQIVLLGSPVDDVENLFYKQITVAIDPETSLPQSVAFAGSDPAATSEPLAVVLSPRVLEPNLLEPDQSARPLQFAARDEKTPGQQSPVRVVEHVTLKPAPLPELPAEILHALSLWEASAQKVQSLHAHVKRFTYDTVAQLEHRAVGKFSYSSTPQIHCTLKPAAIDPQAVSHKRTPEGTAFQLMPSPAEYWQYTAGEIQFSHTPGRPVFVLHQSGANRMRLVSHEEARTFGDQVIPPWDALFQVSARALAERFLIRVTENEHLTTWEFVPRQRKDIGQFREMRVLVDNVTQLPSAVKLLNSRGCPNRHVPSSPAPNYPPIHRWSVPTWS